MAIGFGNEVYNAVERNQETKRTYLSESVTKMDEETILWRNGIYAKKGIMMDTELIVDIYERGRKHQESKIRKMKIALWILGASMFTMANILLFLLI